MIVVMVVLTLLFVLVAGRLVQLQLAKGEWLSARGRVQRVHTVTVPAERGAIFDRNGRELAISVPRQTIWADPRVIRDAPGYAAQLAPILGASVSELSSKLGQSNRAFVYLSRRVDDDVAAKVKALDLPGISMYPESRRYYPGGDLAAPVLGFVGTDGNGLGGLEYSLDNRLTGNAGKFEVERDPQGREIPASEQTRQKPRPGDDLVLTLDQSLQYETERILTEGVAAANAKGGIAVVVDVQTGDVLSMASVDGASGGRPTGPVPAQARNRPLTDVYEPGSTNKVITIAGAIEEGLVSPSTMFSVPDRMKVSDGTFSDHNPHGVEQWTTSDILRESSNVGTIMIGQQLGKDRLDRYLRAFGEGQPTTIGFPGEAGGILLDPKKWSGTSIATVPLGQGLAVTAMQMANVFVTLANGGESRPPRLVAATVDVNGTRREIAPAPSTRVVSPNTAAAMRDMMISVVSNGTGTEAAVPGYSVAGKTGTARKPPYDTPPYKYIASFAGFAPASNPRLASIVVLDEPLNTYYGGLVAAPIFARVMQYALRIESVAPDQPGGGKLAPLPQAPPSNLGSQASSPQSPATTVRPPATTSRSPGTTSSRGGGGTSAATVRGAPAGTG
ncbi:MAG: peptidoglycan D,D-transpeptidase FtsI family protein [Acidimicrobiia bacterium]